MANDGRRITPAEAATLTEPFRRLDRTRSDGSGFGLGLALVQKVATAHGATLDLTPRDDGGLLAVVAFPAVDDERQPDRDRERD